MQLVADGLHKSFPGVHALRGVSLRVAAGEVLALVGENGAGKSTLMKLLAGVYTADAGSIQIDGRPVRFASVASAQAEGIQLIHQELNLCENLSIADNLFLGREHTVGGYLGWLDRARMDVQALGLLRRVGLDVSPRRSVSQLTPGQKQLVEIARSLALSAKLIIMDEPTSSLTARETERLFEVIADLKRQAIAVIYITHRLAEVEQIADRVTVLRDGQNAGELVRGQFDRAALVASMVGRDLTQYYPRTADRPVGDVVLELKGVRYAGGPSHPANLQLRAGEIVGMAGLMGAGRTELAEAVYGLQRITAGEIRLNGKPLGRQNATSAIANGILLVPEDRRHHGVIQAEAIRWNLSLPNLQRLQFLEIVRLGAERTFSREVVAKLRVRCSSDRQLVHQLSGGNQQKVVIGRWMGRSPKVLICDEPTRGVDVGAKAEIYAILDELARTGVAIWMISSDLEEVLGMSDRVVVMHEGKIAGELPREAMTERAIMQLATGG